MHTSHTFQGYFVCILSLKNLLNDENIAELLPDDSAESGFLLGKTIMTGIMPFVLSFYVETFILCARISFTTKVFQILLPSNVNHFLPKTELLKSWRKSSSTKNSV